jgi:carbon storage regulator
MLVLSRNRDETIMIGDNVEITIVDIRGDKVRIGIKAPVSVAVHRKEVYEAIRKENEGASAFCTPSFAGVQPGGGGTLRRDELAGLTTHTDRGTRAVRGIA